MFLRDILKKIPFCAPLVFLFTTASNSSDLEVITNNKFDASYFDAVSAYATAEQAQYAWTQLYVFSISNIFMSIFTIFLIWKTYKQSQKNFEENYKITTQSIENTQKNFKENYELAIQSIINNNRAWIAIVPMAATIYVAGEELFINYAIRIKNWGASPATNLKIKQKIFANVRSAVHEVQGKSSSLNSASTSPGTGRVVFPSEEIEIPFEEKLSLSSVREAIKNNTKQENFNPFEDGLGLLIEIQYSLGGNNRIRTTYGTYYVAKNSRDDFYHSAYAVQDWTEEFSGQLTPYDSGHATT